ncbi:MAG TPA: Os1348 family NHLP clan protein [Thermomicrobiales bacterium]|jgi:hypothetical protein
MERNGLDVLLDRWLNDPAFRDGLGSDPESAIRASGIDLSAEEWDALRAAKYDLSDGALAERVNKPRLRL